MKHASRSITRLLGVAILLATWVATARAQTQGGISGLVTDSSGGAIPGATVTVTNTATRGTRTTTTNADGLYSFPSLPPGVYALKVELQGFKTAELPQVKVDVEQTVRLDVPLQVGKLEEMVTVSGKSTLLNTESTTIGTVIENNQFIHRSGGDLSRRHLILWPDRPVDHDHDQPAFRPDVVGRHVRRDVANPRRDAIHARWTLRDLNGIENGHRPRFAVLEYGEIAYRQVAHRTPVVIQDGDVQLDERRRPT
jgi:hypothetical protein